MNRVTDWIKIALAALGVVSMWLIFWLRPLLVIEPGINPAQVIKWPAPLPPIPFLPGIPKP